MRTCKGKPSVVVIETSRSPCGSVVAHLALLRKSSRYVIRIGGSLIILQMTVHASCAGDVVVPIDVALTALHINVGACKRPSSRGMIEFRRIPAGRVVADLALLGESCRSVVRVRGPLIVLQVASRTCSTRQCEIPVHMALCALHPSVCARQWPS
jgi:hypothetical protein